MAPESDVRGRNVADLVREAASRRPAATALVHRSEGGRRTTTTWAALDADVTATAAGLGSELGLHPGDRVAMVLGTTTAFVTTYFAVLRAGMVAVPLNPGLTSPEVARLLHEAGATVVVHDDPATPVVEEAVAETHRALVDPAGLESVTAAGRGADLEPSSGGEDLAVLLFTSGTSGRPRGAMLSHRALLANLGQCRLLDPSPVVENDVVLLALPLFHVYGLNTGLGMVAATGATGVLVDRFDPVGTAAVVRDEGVTAVPGAPQMYAAWAAADQLGALSGVRLLASGSAPLPVAVLERVRTGAGREVHEGYGLTETAPVLTSTLASATVKAGSIGRAVPGVEVRLVDERGAAVADGDPGEIQVRGANVFSGYWPDRSGGPDDDGWWPTGDVAYADTDGDLFLVDRRRELVLVNGFNVYPREVEDALAEHPDVQEVAVIAVPDDETGEAVKAYVVARAGAGLTADDVSAHAATRLARFKRPTVVEIVAELPHSATGKVAKGRLRADGGLG